MENLRLDDLVRSLSIRLPRRSIDVTGAPVIVETTGRHDPCVGIRATPICESMLALVLIEHALRHRAQNADVHCPTPRIAAAAPASADPGVAVPSREDADPSEA